MVDLQVQPVLHDVHPTGNVLGVDGYGTVEEVEVTGTMCIAKCLQKSEILLKGRFGDAILRRFASECKLMSNLRHPHIVTFLGTSIILARVAGTSNGKTSLLP